MHIFINLGICIIPLGFDNMGREYWKFPTSPDLYIKNSINQTNRNLDKDNFNNLIIMNEDFDNDGNSDYDSDNSVYESEINDLSDLKESFDHPRSDEKGTYINMYK
jgi:hypothetical protein